MKYPKFYLASKSPRRHQIFADAGFETEILENNADESFDEKIPIREVAEYLAVQKAAPFKSEMHKTIVTADTTVILGNQILNKPRDAKHASEMLNSLSGNVHEVITGVCFIHKGKQAKFSECTRVWVKELKQEEIDEYITKYKPFDKAGAYGIQDWMGLVGVEKIDGCFYNVMGFPMHRFVQMFHEAAE